MNRAAGMLFIVLLLTAGAVAVFTGGSDARPSSQGIDTAVAPRTSAPSGAESRLAMFRDAGPARGLPAVDDRGRFAADGVFGAARADRPSRVDPSLNPLPSRPDADARSAAAARQARTAANEELRHRVNRERATRAAAWPDSPPASRNVRPNPSRSGVPNAGRFNRSNYSTAQQTAAAQPPFARTPSDGAAPGDSNDASAFDDLIPDSLSPELQALVRQLLEDSGIDPSNPGGSSTPGGSNPGSNGNTGNNNADNAGADAGDPGGNTDAADDSGTTNVDGDAADGSSTIPAVTGLVWINPTDLQPCLDDADQPLAVNDLFVRLDGPGRITAVDSAISSAGLRFVGGLPFDDPAGSDRRPTTSLLAAEPCVGLDTFFVIGDADIAFASSPNVQLGPAGLLTTTYFRTPTAGNDPARAVQDAARFGDDAFYVRIARIAAGADVSTITGQLFIGVAPEVGSGGASTLVTVPDEPDRWLGLTPPDDPGNEPGDPGSEPSDPGSEPSDPGSEPGDPGNEPSDPGNEPSDPGNEPGDPGNEPSDPGNEPGDPGNEPSDPGETGPALVWREITRTAACNDSTGADFSNTVTFELYVRLDEPHTVLLASTGVTEAETMSFTAPPRQHPFGDNTLPNPALVDVAPCLEFDSYFTLGALGSNGIFFVEEPDDQAWPDPLTALWASTTGAIAQQNPAFFDGSTAYFVRLMRVTLDQPGEGDPPLGVTGELFVGYQVFGGVTTRSLVLDVPPLP